jgi:hypothetical protein
MRIRTDGGPSTNRESGLPPREPTPHHPRGFDPGRNRVRSKPGGGCSLLTLANGDNAVSKFAVGDRVRQRYGAVKEIGVVTHVFLRPPGPTARAYITRVQVRWERADRLGPLKETELEKVEE